MFSDAVRRLMFQSMAPQALQQHLEFHSNHTRRIGRCHRQMQRQGQMRVLSTPRIKAQKHCQSGRLSPKEKVFFGSHNIKNSSLSNRRAKAQAIEPKDLVCNLLATRGKPKSKPPKKRLSLQCCSSGESPRIHHGEWCVGRAG